MRLSRRDRTGDASRSVPGVILKLNEERSGESMNAFGTYVGQLEALFAEATSPGKAGRFSERIDIALDGSPAVSSAGWWG